ncbi:MAG: hypothetical protein JWM88_43 [Verrucomicrobia bacterium]|nr:hypothetical protein [Verrucomicrobiota bacterium]
MKLVAVSIVKNEADVIEPFVRHARAWTDHHLVFDHDSTDGTREILGRLLAEGLPLTVFTDDALGNLQQARSNHLTRLAVTDWGADWIFPLDADEFLTGPGRPALEKCLAGFSGTGPATLPLLNYYPTPRDNPAETNPVVRLTHCKPGNARKIIVPAALAADPGAAAGKGSHAIYRGDRALPEQLLPAPFQLAHFSLRSPGQQAMRIALAELQKLSRGRAHEGLDVHYRLSFQLLAENPELFFETSLHRAENLRTAPLDYLGGPLRFTAAATESHRIIRALLPYLEKLASSHGQLMDRIGAPVMPMETGSPLRRLSAEDLTASTYAGRDDAFSGYRIVGGLGPNEGPVPEAYLPNFHWGQAPATELLVESPAPRQARLAIEALTYAERQDVAVELNGTVVHRHVFQRVNQRERIVCALPLRAGENHLVLRYAGFLQTAIDPRQLAVIYLSLRIA